MLGEVAKAAIAELYKFSIGENREEIKNFFTFDGFSENSEPENNDESKNVPSYGAASEEDDEDLFNE